MAIILPSIETMLPFVVTLLTLSLAHNCLVGTVDPNLSSLTNLWELDLSHNYLCYMVSVLEAVQCSAACAMEIMLPNPWHSMAWSVVSTYALAMKRSVLTRRMLLPGRHTLQDSNAD
eukprot:1932450-Rhodomonas_salina.8